MMLKGILSPPEYHFFPPKGWMNDPNGLIQFNGVHHLFYQYNPENPFGPMLNRMRWGHAKSVDLVNWEHLPAALEPDQPYDRGGVWSGCAVEDGGEVVVFYTGVSGGGLRRQSQCVAVSRGGALTDWKKYEGNPVIPRPPEGVSPWCFRDPYVWRHGDCWLMAIGAGLRGRGAVLLYRSADLFKWEYAGPLAAGSSRRHGRVWECPNFFYIGGRWVLIVSVIPWKVIYFIGEFDGRKFRPEREGVLDRGSCFYAPQAFAGADGRRILFGWLREETPLAAVTGRQGALSLPRVVTLGADGGLRLDPAAEVKLLRRECVLETSQVISPGHPCVTGELKSAAFEIEVEFENSGGRRFGARLQGRRSFGGGISIYYDGRKRGLCVDRALPGAGNFFAPLDVRRGDILKVRIFVDSSIVEIFAGGRACIACRMYPLSLIRPELQFFSEGSSCPLRSVKVHEMG